MDDTMTTVKKSNAARSACRKKCREKLANHIMANIGVFVEPNEIRLITRDEDPYAWEVLPEKKHLFQKHLSKHSIGAYCDLCRSVGVSFEAVVSRGSAKKTDGAVAEKITDDIPGSNISFTIVIEQLQTENKRLAQQPEQNSITAIKADESKSSGDDEILHLKAMVSSLEINKQMLQQEIQTLTNILAYFREATVESVNELRGKLNLDLNMCATS